MKKSILLLFAALVTLMASAQQAKVEIDGIWYHLNDWSSDWRTAMVTYPKNYFESLYNGTITIPSTVTYENKKYNVTEIEDYAFKQCWDLGAVTIPNSVGRIGKDAFEYCTSLTTVNISNNVVIIDRGAFKYCTSLTDITIPNSVTYIGDHAFSDCRSITSIHIPERVDSIEYNPFHGCFKLNSITVSKGNTKYDSRDGCNAIIRTSSNSLITGCSATTIPKNVTSIENRAFNGCVELSSITIPESVTSIGQSVFNGCRNLTSIVVDKKNPIYDSRKDCNAIVEKSSNTLIAGCSTTTITDVICIGDEAFWGCENLTNITIPEGVTSIGEDAFRNCSSLTAITIPEDSKLTSIGGYAFRNCSSLTAITIPKSVSSIGSYTFEGCTSLTGITCEAETPPTIDNNTFYAFDKSIPVYVPAGSVAVYKSTKYWNEFTNIIGIETGIDKSQSTSDNSQQTFYDLNGRRVEKVEKGIYIIDGRKVMVK